MAFPLPDHLPRKQDVSSAILTKIGNATTSTLNAAEASQWLSELDSTILATKRQIHERISGSLPEFERQFNSAISVQERLASLKRNVSQLDTAVSAPEV
jgi:centromere/kinetochore protein ZW10